MTDFLTGGSPTIAWFATFVFASIVIGIVALLFAAGIIIKKWWEE